MWTNIDKFSTPPPTWRKQRPPPSPMSERKRMSPMKTKDDLFHVIYKVPAGDSPYGRAKHIQLIDKDPSRAVSMFWAAINAGDRVDSALKDMAIVMKQLNRSDEAIEAIKSFRHLCPPDSQESLDNVLIELYKRCGRIEEEIEMLQCKLKNIEEGKAFGGAKTKLARSQGKKIHITIEQERSRILGNLAWAYLQKNEYEIAEQHYRKALSLEADKNKQCNLAICLIHMNRMMEAKALLQSVKTSAGKKQIDESYAKSFERALQMLNELESPSVSEPSDQEEHSNVENRRPFGLTADLTYGGQNHSSHFSVTRSLTDGHDEEIVLLNEDDGAAFCRNHLKNKNRGFGYNKRNLKRISTGPAVTSQFTPHTLFANNWRKGSIPERQCGRSGNASTIKEPWARSPGRGLSFAQQEAYASPSVERQNFEVPFTQPRPSWGLSDGEWRMEREGNDHVLSEQSTLSENAVLFTQPRISSSRGFNMGDQRGGKWGEKTVCNSVRKLSFEQAIDTENVHEKGLPSPTSEDWMMTSLGDIGQVIDGAVIQPPTQPKFSCWEDDGFDQTKDDIGDRNRKSTWKNNDDYKKFALKESNSGITLPTGPSMVVVDTTTGLKTSFDDQTSEMSDIVHPFIAEKAKSSQDCTLAQGKKSWADMVEEEEEKQESLCEKISGDSLDVWNMEEENQEEFNDENLNSNVINPSSCEQNQIDYLSQKLEDSLDLKSRYAISKCVLSKNQTVQRSLCFGQYQKLNKGLNSVLLKDKDFLSGKNINMKTRTRLQVFQDITPSPDSP